jgi:hypothetical protein
MRKLLLISIMASLSAGCVVQLGEQFYECHQVGGAWRCEQIQMQVVRTP